MKWYRQFPVSTSTFSLTTSVIGPCCCVTASSSASSQLSTPSANVSPPSIVSSKWAGLDCGDASTCCSSSILPSRKPVVVNSVTRTLLIWSAVVSMKRLTFELWPTWQFGDDVLLSLTSWMQQLWRLETTSICPSVSVQTSPDLWGDSADLVSSGSAKWDSTKTNWKQQLVVRSSRVSSGDDAHVTSDWLWCETWNESWWASLCVAAETEGRFNADEGWTSSSCSSCVVFFKDPEISDRKLWLWMNSLIRRWRVCSKRIRSVDNVSVCWCSWCSEETSLSSSSSSSSSLWILFSGFSCEFCRSPLVSSSVVSHDFTSVPERLNSFSQTFSPLSVPPEFFDRRQTLSVASIISFSDKSTSWISDDVLMNLFSLLIVMFFLLTSPELCSSLFVLTSLSRLSTADKLSDITFPLMCFCLCWIAYVCFLIRFDLLFAARRETRLASSFKLFQLFFMLSCWNLLPSAGHRAPLFPERRWGRLRTSLCVKLTKMLN